MRWILFLCLITANLYADESKDSKAESSSSTKNTKTIKSSISKDFDDRVFETSPPAVEPVLPTSPKGNQFYPGGSAKYNTEQKQRALETCQPEKRISMRAFRKCFNEEIKKELDAVEQRINAVENRQARPLRNAPAQLGLERGNNSPVIEVERIYEKE